MKDKVMLWFAKTFGKKKVGTDIDLKGNVTECIGYYYFGKHYIDKIIKR